MVDGRERARDVTIEAVVSGAGHRAHEVIRSARSALRTGARVTVVAEADEAAALAPWARRHSVSVVILTEPADDAATYNEIIERMNSTHLAWIEGGTVLDRKALAIARSIIARFETDFLYADSRDQDGRLIARPVPSPLRMEAHDHVGGFRIMSVSAIQEVGGIRSCDRGTEADDLSRRIWSRGLRIVHAPQVLARESAAFSTASAPRPIPPARNRIDPAPVISVLIPTRGSSALVHGEHRVLVTDLVGRIVRDGSDVPLEFIIVADDETPQSVIDDLMAIPADLRLVRWSSAFNFSAKINRGAAHARGDYLLLLNDDLEPISSGWIEAMVDLGQRPGVGVVGALLHFEDGSVQHGGHVYRDSHAGHVAFGRPSTYQDPLRTLEVVREVSGVTAACALVSAETFHRVGGFSNVLPGNYNDVDFCLKVREQGLSIIWTPDARLFHFESKTRDATVAPSEIARLRDRWMPRIQVDMYSTD